MPTNTVSQLSSGLSSYMHFSIAFVHAPPAPPGPAFFGRPNALVALTSAFYAGRLILFSDQTPESFDQAWTIVAEEALLAGSLLFAATLGIAALDRRRPVDDAARFREAGDRSRDALLALLAGDDAILKRALVKAARAPPKRGAAAVCRNLLLDEYVDATTAEALKQKHAAWLNPTPRPKQRPVPMVFEPDADGVIADWTQRKHRPRPNAKARPRTAATQAPEPVEKVPGE